MRRQALKMHEWQENVYVKIPVTNTSGESSVPLIEQLANEGVKVNVTALLTPRQVKAVTAALNPDVPAVISVFAGRIADTGVDPLPIMKESLEIVSGLPKAELLGERSRGPKRLPSGGLRLRYSYGPHDILKKLVTLGGKDLDELARHGAHVSSGRRRRRV
jgi:transaldolase